MKQKVFCPYCGRCLGECVVSDDSGGINVLKNSPAKTSKKHLIHDMKCVKCKEQVLILLEFKN